MAHFSLDCCSGLRVEHKGLQYASVVANCTSTEHVLVVDGKDLDNNPIKVSGGFHFLISLFILILFLFFLHCCV